VVYAAEPRLYFAVAMSWIDVLDADLKPLQRVPTGQRQVLRLLWLEERQELLTSAIDCLKCWRFSPSLLQLGRRERGPPKDEHSCLIERLKFVMPGSGAKSWLFDLVVLRDWMFAVAGTSLLMVSVLTGAVLAKWAALHVQSITCVAVHCRGGNEYVITGDAEGGLKIWSLFSSLVDPSRSREANSAGTLSLLTAFIGADGGHRDAVTSIAAHPDPASEVFYSVSRDSSVRGWSLSSLKRTMELTLPGAVKGVVTAPPLQTELDQTGNVAIWFAELPESTMLRTWTLEGQPDEELDGDAAGAGSQPSSSRPSSVGVAQVAERSSSVQAWYTETLAAADVRAAPDSEVIPQLRLKQTVHSPAPMGEPHRRQLASAPGPMRPAFSATGRRAKESAHLFSPRLRDTMKAAESVMSKQASADRQLQSAGGSRHALPEASRGAGSPRSPRLLRSPRSPRNAEVSPRQTRPMPQQARGNHSHSMVSLGKATAASTPRGSASLQDLVRDLSKRSVRAANGIAAEVSYTSTNQGGKQVAAGRLRGAPASPLPGLATLDFVRRT